MAYVLKRYNGTSWVPAVKRYWDGSKWVGVGGAGDMSVYSSEVLADNPVGYWRLGEASGTTAVDETGVHNGTYNGSPALGASGLITVTSDTAVSFDGVDDEVSIPDANVFTPGSTTGDGFTVEMWVKRAGALPAAREWLATKAGLSAEYEWGLNLGSTGAVNLTMWQVGGANVATSGNGTTDITDDLPHHIVGTYEYGVLIAIYVDGVRENSSTSFSGSVTNTANPVLLGERGDGAEGRYVGVMDEVAIYNYALSSTRIQTHYNAGVA